MSEPHLDDALRKLVRGEDLTEPYAEDLLRLLADSRAEAAWAGAVLAALQTKGLVAAEVRGFAAGMRELARAVHLSGPAVDIVGTGGDGSGSLNLSTGASLLLAACGVPVVKHGNRGVSSQSGSSDVLEALGYTAPEGPEEALESLSRHGYAFLHAPYFHPAMRSLGPVRQALGIRTVFNILGPLTNPATPPFTVVGAYSPDVAALMAEALSGMAIQRGFVVHGHNGWDEATPVGPFTLWDVRPDQVTRSVRDPRDAGLEPVEEDALRGGDATYNANAIRDAFSGGDAGHQAALALNAALGLEVAGEVPNLEAGVRRAREVIEDGGALRKLEELT